MPASHFFGRERESGIHACLSIRFFFIHKDGVEFNCGGAVNGIEEGARADNMNWSLYF